MRIDRCVKPTEYTTQKEMAQQMHLAEYTDTLAELFNSGNWKQQGKKNTLTL